MKIYQLFLIFLAIKRGVADARCAAPHADHNFTISRSLSGIAQGWLLLRLASLSEVSPSNSFSTKD